MSRVTHEPRRLRGAGVRGFRGLRQHLREKGSLRSSREETQRVALDTVVADLEVLMGSRCHARRTCGPDTLPLGYYRS